MFFLHEIKQQKRQHMKYSLWYMHVISFNFALYWNLQDIKIKTFYVNLCVSTINGSLNSGVWKVYYIVLHLCNICNNWQKNPESHPVNNSLISGPVKSLYCCLLLPVISIWRLCSLLEYVCSIKTTIVSVFKSLQMFQNFNLATNVELNVKGDR